MSIAADRLALLMQLHGFTEPEPGVLRINNGLECPWREIRLRDGKVFRFIQDSASEEEISVAHVKQLREWNNPIGFWLESKGFDFNQLDEPPPKSTKRGSLAPVEEQQGMLF
jgi:hypothetical protein